MYHLGFFRQLWLIAQFCLIHIVLPHPILLPLRWYTTTVDKKKTGIWMLSKYINIQMRKGPAKCASSLPLKLKFVCIIKLTSSVMSNLNLLIWKEWYIDPVCFICIILIKTNKKDLFPRLLKISRFCLLKYHFFTKTNYRINVRNILTMSST